ncbi:Ig-like domain-containing protein [Conexibacter sp. SYSU D00693]|uniref:Ig-like domain-containing protein n=1 Tax=Conexibacter sp. SYSU D00693 TaxID=2812560 RepID=UPI00196B8DA1|nr:Ig-like domain-containing protein [Conexibacter sp. SYSU D00693]
MRRTIGCGLAAITALALAAPASAAPPGDADGYIAYDTASGVKLVRPDGTDKRGLGAGTQRPGGFSPDGRRLVLLAKDAQGQWKVALHDVVTGARTLMQVPVSATPHTGFASLEDLRWAVDGEAVLGIGGEIGVDPETGQVSTRPVLWRWTMLTAGAAPAVVKAGPWGGVIAQAFDVGTAGGLAFVTQSAVDTLLSYAPTVDAVFGGVPRLATVSGVSFAPEAAWLLTRQAGDVLRMAPPAGPPVGVVAGVSGDPETTPTSGGVVRAIRSLGGQPTQGLFRFNALAGPDQPLARIPNTEDASDGRHLAVQPVHATTTDVDPVLLRFVPPALGLLRFTAKVTDRFGPVAGGSVVFRTRAGAPGCTATTNRAGVATCTATVGWLQALVSGGVTARFAGDAAHLPSSDSAGLLG